MVAHFIAFFCIHKPTVSNCADELIHRGQPLSITRHMLPGGRNLQQSLSDWQRYANSCRFNLSLSMLKNATRLQRICLQKQTRLR